jgi:outer membrane protein
MKRTLLMATFCLLTLGRAEAAPPRIGYVDLQRTLNETRAGKAARERLESEKKRKQTEIDKQQTALKKEFDDFEKQKLVLKDDARAKKERELQEKYVGLQNKFMELQQELSKSEAKLTREILEKAGKIIEDIAKSQGYSMIVEKNEGAVLWADPTNDITSELNKRLDSMPSGGTKPAGKKGGK